MKVILLKEVQGLGRAGEIKEVADGYARNFLIVRGIADFVTKHNQDVMEAQKSKREKLAVKTYKEKQKLAKKINSQKFEIKTKADDKGTLYSKITAKTIVGELVKQGINIKEKEVKLDQAVKKVGEHEVNLELGGENVKIKLEVISEK